MKTETIWNLEDLLSAIENNILDYEFDIKDSEQKKYKDENLHNLKEANLKKKELKNCIKWLKTLK